MTKATTRMFSLLMAFAMMFSIMVSAYASDEVQPYYDNPVALTAGVSYAGQNYYGSVSAPVGTSQINMTVTLYQKNLLGYKELDSMSKTVYTRACNKTKSYGINSEKTYKVKIDAEVCVDGSWETISESFIV